MAKRKEIITNRNHVYLKINGKEHQIDDPKQLYGLCLSFILHPKYAHSKFNVMKENIFNICDIIEEGCKELREKEYVKKIDCTNVVKKVNNLKKFLEYKPDIDSLKSHLYGRLMVAENLGPLKGFGFANKFGDPLYGDSERQSTVNSKVSNLVKGNA